MKSFALVLSLVALVACKKDASAPADASAPIKPKPPKPLVMADSTAGVKLVVKAKHPDGWSQTVDGGLTIFTDPTPALAYPSTLAFGEGCLAPPCAKVPEDSDAVVKAMTDGFTKAGASDVKATKTAATDGFSIDFDLTRDSGPVHVYARAQFQSGWPAEATCVAVASDTLILHADELKAACDAMTVTPRGG
jgi:hypothetical protein